MIRARMHHLLAEPDLLFAPRPLHVPGSPAAADDRDLRRRFHTYSHPFRLAVGELAYVESISFFNQYPTDIDLTRAFYGSFKAQS